MSRLSERLIELRKERGYSQEELADYIGVSRQAISKWERDESLPDTSNLIAISELYGLSVDEMLAHQVQGDWAKEEPSARNKNEIYSSLMVAIGVGCFIMCGAVIVLFGEMLEGIAVAIGLVFVAVGVGCCIMSEALFPTKKK